MTFACVPCRQSKKSCDQNRPCRRCTVRGISHSCIDRQRRKRLVQSSSEGSPDTSLSAKGTASRGSFSDRSDRSNSSDTISNTSDDSSPGVYALLNGKNIEESLEMAGEMSSLSLLSALSSLSSSMPVPASDSKESVVAKIERSPSPDKASPVTSDYADKPTPESSPKSSPTTGSETSATVSAEDSVPSATPWVTGSGVPEAQSPKSSSGEQPTSFASTANHRPMNPTLLATLGIMGGGRSFYPPVRPTSSIIRPIARKVMPCSLVPPVCHESDFRGGITQNSHLNPLSHAQSLLCTRHDTNVAGMPYKDAQYERQNAKRRRMNAAGRAQEYHQFHSVFHDKFINDHYLHPNFTLNNSIMMQHAMMNINNRVTNSQFEHPFYYALPGQLQSPVIHCLDNPNDPSSKYNLDDLKCRTLAARFSFNPALSTVKPPSIPSSASLNVKAAERKPAGSLNDMSTRSACMVEGKQGHAENTSDFTAVEDRKGAQDGTSNSSEPEDAGPSHSVEQVRP